MKESSMCCVALNCQPMLGHAKPSVVQIVCPRADSISQRCAAWSVGSDILEAILDSHHTYTSWSDDNSRMMRSATNTCRPAQLDQCTAALTVVLRPRPPSLSGELPTFQVSSSRARLMSSRELAVEFPVCLQFGSRVSSVSSGNASCGTGAPSTADVDWEARFGFPWA